MAKGKGPDLSHAFDQPIRVRPDPRVAGRYWLDEDREKHLIDAATGPRRRKPAPKGPPGEQTRWIK